MLGEFFGLPVRIQEFVGQWLEIPDGCRFVLGAVPETGSLGSSAPIGSQVWDCQQKFRVVFGPLDLEDYQRLLPGGASLRRLADLIENYLGDEWEWDVQLILKRDQVPPKLMGGLGCLGWTDWMDHEVLTADADDLILDPSTAPPV